MELRSALESEDPLLYESAFPVHQDGSCNGLQHYAALVGDLQGAKQVNLGVTDRQQCQELVTNGFVAWFFEHGF
jgi:DNA-directed RNA polymerase, mitochondrial